MKVTIERSYNPISDEYYFWVVVDDNGKKFSKALCFKPNVPEDDIYNEEKNYNAAIALAKRIEANGTADETRQIIYSNEQ